jgi:SAM-dependent methyltransferase
MNGSLEESPWYCNAFGELYSLIYPHRDDRTAAAEIAGLLRILEPLETGARVLDVGCGTGRHAVALTRAACRVHAIDLSPALLATACARCELAGRLIRADMRRLPVRPVYDLVLSLFTSFGYFASDTENETALREMAGALRPAGRLVLDLANRTVIERTLVPEDVQERAGLRIRQRRRLTGARVRKEIEVEWEDGRRACFHEDVRLYTPQELLPVIQSLGLGDVVLYGSYEGAAWGPSAERMLVIARKPGPDRRKKVV